MDYYLAFLAGLFGSMHCVGMCGAIVLAYSTQQNAEARPALSSIPSHLAYNSGRILSKTIVGALFGLLGASFAGMETVTHYFSGVAGFLLIFAGIWMLKIIPGTGFPEKLPMQRQARTFLFRIYAKTYGKLLQTNSAEGKFYIGMLTPLLPCGLLYSMFFRAAATGSAVQGALIMFFFAIAIFPALFITGIASSYFGAKMRSIGDKLAAITIIIMGLMMVLRAFDIPLPWMGGGGHGH
jgi:uncharacterized protein